MTDAYHAYQQEIARRLQLMQEAQAERHGALLQTIQQEIRQQTKEIVRAIDELREQLKETSSDA